MSKLLYGFLFLILLSGPFCPSLAHAHVGHSEDAASQKAAPPEEYTAEESEYAIGGEEPTLDETELMDEESMGTATHQDMPGMKHKMPQVTLSEHELVSPSQKGYYAAVGITIFAGLVFGILGVKRN